MREPKSVALSSHAPSVRPTSSEAVRARSASSPSSGSTRVRPIASVSSVNGVGAKYPVAAAARTVHPAGRRSSASRGLKKVPYSLCRSTRPATESVTHSAGANSSCANSDGVTCV